LISLILPEERPQPETVSEVDNADDSDTM
jgi:hypothetical protein